MLMPNATLVVPLFLELNAVRLIGTMWSIILPYSFYPFGVYLTYIYFTTAVPKDLLAAARMDGCSEFGVFRHIALPLATPVIALVGFFSFVANWTNYFLPYVMLPDSNQMPIQVGVGSLLSNVPSFNPTVGNLAIQRPQLALATLVAITPVLVVFLFAQRFLVSGMLALRHQGVTAHAPQPRPPLIRRRHPGLRPARTRHLGRSSVARTPGWAIAQRALFDLLDDAWRRFARDFTGPDGRLNYTGPLTTRDGVDDFYEVFFNWPQLYLLGGADDLLPASEKHWEGVTRQLTELDMLRDEFERGYDWFHQGESLLLLYFLSMAAPDRWRERALRFAELYVDPANGNYDPAHRIITRPHNGSDPERTGLFDGDVYPWLPKEAQTYGFPLDWIPEAANGPFPLSADPRLGNQMRDRTGVGDTAVNLAAAGLVLNAWILSGQERYRAWIIEYVGAWRERTREQGGLIPDNVGPDGDVGSLLEGRWYGGHYGWSWPHGWHSVGHAACVAALAAATVTGDDDYLSMVATSLDTLIGHAKVMPYTEADSSLPSKWAVELGPDRHTPTPHLPFRHNDSGWFDYNPATPPVPVALWHHTSSQADRARLEGLREADAIDWRTVRPFRSKEDSGHEKAWFAFLAA